MTVTELLADVTRRGIELVADGDRLRYRPRSAVTADLAERLKTHKAELLAILGHGGDPGVAPVGQAEVASVDSLGADGRPGDVVPWWQAHEDYQRERVEKARKVADDAQRLRATSGLPPWGAAPRPGECRRCRSTAVRDVPIHNGQSVRRDCAVCARFVGFMLWSGAN